MASYHLLLAAIFLSASILSGGHSALARGGGERKMTHLRFYMHDILSGKNQSAFPVVKTPYNLAGLRENFGNVVVIDDPLTAGPDPTSAPVGRGQGIYVPADSSPDRTKFALLLVANLVIEQGPYKGSTLAIMGRDEIFAPVREIPIAGGTGAFRLARGYVLITTFSDDISASNAVLRMNVYITKN